MPRCLDGGGVGVCSRLWLWRKGNSAMWVRVEDEATLLDEEEKLVELAAVEGTGVGVEELERMKAAMRDEDSMASFARSARASATRLVSMAFSLASSSRARCWATSASYSSRSSAASVKRKWSFSVQQGGS